MQSGLPGYPELILWATVILINIVALLRFFNTFVKKSDWLQALDDWEEHCIRCKENLTQNQKDSDMTVKAELESIKEMLRVVDKKSTFVQVVQLEMLDELNEKLSLGISDDKIKQLRSAIIGNNNSPRD